MTDEEEEKELTINDLAGKLKEAFKDATAKKYGKPYRPHKRYDSLDAWRKTAEVVYALHADPVDYIAAQFKLSKTRVFANTLHGQVAQSRYKQYALRYDLVKLKNAPGEEDSPVSVSKYEIHDRILYTYGQLMNLYKKTDVYDPVVIQAAAEDPARFDPLAMMLLGGAHTTYQKLFKVRAAEILAEDPCLARAAKQLGYDVDNILS